MPELRLHQMRLTTRGIDRILPLSSQPNLNKRNAKLLAASFTTLTGLNSCPSPGLNPETPLKPPIQNQEAFPDDYAGFTARWICNSKNPFNPNSPSIINRIGESGTTFKTWSSPEFDIFSPGAVESAKKLWTDGKDFGPTFLNANSRETADIEIGLYENGDNFYGSKAVNSLGASTTVYEFDSKGDIIKAVKGAIGIFKDNVIKYSKSSGKSIKIVVENTIGHELAHNFGSGGFKSRDDHHPDNDSFIPEKYIWKTGNNQEFYVPEKLRKVLKLVYQRPNGAPCPQEIPQEYRFKPNSLIVTKFTPRKESEWQTLSDDGVHKVITQRLPGKNGKYTIKIITLHRK
jgi:hypothetical protein